MSRPATVHLKKKKSCMCWRCDFKLEFTPDPGNKTAPDSFKKKKRNALKLRPDIYEPEPNCIIKYSLKPAIDGSHLGRFSRDWLRFEPRIGRLHVPKPID